MVPVIYRGVPMVSFIYRGVPMMFAIYRGVPMVSAIYRGVPMYNNYTYDIINIMELIRCLYNYPSPTHSV